MIDIKSLKEENKGKWVVYNDGVRRPEVGKIKSWNDKYIFVVYKTPGKDMDSFDRYTGVATDPEKLEWLL